MTAATLAQFALSVADAMTPPRRIEPERRAAARQLLLRALTLETMRAECAMAIECLLEFETAPVSDFERQAEALCGAAETLEQIAADYRDRSMEMSDPAMERRDQAWLRGHREAHAGVR